MKKVNAKLFFFVLIILILAAAVAFIVMNHSKSANQVVTQQQTVQTQSAVTPTPTVDPSTYSDINVPEGITIVNAPESANDTYIGSNSNSTSSSTNNNIYIVDNPYGSSSSTSTNGNNIYVVTTPNANSSSSSNGIYIVDGPTGGSSGSGSNSGIYIVDDPTGGGSSGGGGSSSGGTTLRTGSFSGSNGGLTILVNYSVTTISNSSAQVVMDATLSHGNLSSTSQPVSFNCYGQYGSSTAPSISGSGSTYLGSKTFTINLAKGESTTINLGASWKFNGSYSGQYIDSVSASTSVSLSR